MIRLRVLGEVELFSATGAGLEAVIRQPKRLALLVYLLCGPRRFHRRDTLLALFWPDHDAAHARAALRRALFFLRRHLGDGVIETRGDDVAVTREGVWCDAIEFDAAMARGEPAVAVPLYRGPLLDGVFLPSAPDVERWLDDERPRRRRLAADGALALARTAEGAGDVAAATRWAGAAADLSDDEEALAFRLHLLTRFQRRDEALAVFQRYAERRRADLDLAPSPELQAVADAIRAAPPRRPPIAVAEPERVVAVLPFAVRGAPELAYLAEGMIDLLSAKLDAVAGLRTVDPLAILPQVRATGGAADPESARLLAAGLHAGWFVLGSIVGTGDTLHAAATLYRTDGGEEVRGSVECARDAGPGGFVDQLARQLLVGHSEASGGRATSLAGATTDSLPALRAFLGAREARRLGRYEAARDGFAGAVAADPLFALGHVRHAGMLAACAQLAEARAACAAAGRLRERLSERDRLLLDAQAAWFDGDAATAEVLYWRVIAEAPDDVEAWFQLGDTQFDANPYRGRSCTEARPAFERVLELDPDHVGAMLHLARIESLEHRLDALERLARRIDALSPGSDQALAARGMSAFARADRGQQAALVAALAGRRLRSIARVAGDVVLYAVGIDALDGVARVLLRVTPDGALGVLHRIVLALVAAAGGAWSEAERELDRADHPAALIYRGLLATLPTRAADRAALQDVCIRLESWRPAPTMPQPNSVLAVLDEAQPILRHYLLGLAHAWLGDAPRAEAAAAACAALDPPVSAPLLNRQLAAGIRARSALEQDDPHAALQMLRGMRCPGWPELVIWSPFHGYAAERLALAQAAAATGRHAEAAAWAAGLAQRSPTEVVFRAEAIRIGLLP